MEDFFRPGQILKTEDIAAANAEIALLRTKLAAAVEVLREIEWAGNHRDNTCPDCHAFRDDQAIKIPGGPEREWHHSEEWREHPCGLRAVLLANQDLPLTTTAPLPATSPGSPAPRPQPPPD